MTPGRWQQASIESLNFGLILLALVLNGIVVHRNTIALHQMHENVLRGHDMLIDIEDVLSQLTVVQSVIRESASKHDLRQFRDAAVALKTSVSSLREHAVANSQSVGKIDELQSQLATAVDATVRNLTALEQPTVLTSSGQVLAPSRELFERAKEAALSIKNDENQFLNAKAVEKQEKLVTILVANIAAVCVALLASAVAWRLIDGQIKRCRQAEFKAEAERENLLVTLTSIGDAVIVTNETGQIRLMNPVAERLLAVNESLVGQPLQDAFRIASDSTGQPIQNPVARALQMRTIVEQSGPVSLARRDGTIVTIEDTASPIRDSSGQITGAVLVFRDCTERRKSEIALRESQRRFHILAESMPQIVWTAMPDGQIDYVNRTAIEYSGQSEEDFMGKGLEPLLHDDDRSAYEISWNSVLRTGQRLELEHRLRQTNGDYRWHLTRALPVFDAANRITQWIGTSTDIDDHKRIEVLLQEEHQRKDQFLALVAHELRNPLAPLGNAVQVLAATQKSGQQSQDLVAIMQRQVQLMTRLIDDLLDVARVTQGRAVLHRERILASAVATAAIDTAQARSPDGEMPFYVTLPTDPLWIDGDLPRLTQVITHLVQYVARQEDPPRDVSLIVERDANDVLYRVSPKGIDSQPTNPATASSSSSSEELKAVMGVGMTLARTLIELHGGALTIQSDPQGSVTQFIVRIPIAEAPHKQRAETTFPDSNEKLPVHKVLVVDDVRASAKTLGLMLSVLGQDVDMAFDGTAALAKVGEAPFDIVFLDIAMPGMDGLEVAHQIRSNPKLKGLTLVALTGFDEERDVRRSLEAGFNEHLVKPTSIDLLRAVIQRASAQPGQPAATEISGHCT